MKIIDTHTHCFPDSLASRALGGLQKVCGITPCTDGTHGGLLASMERNGIDASVICSIATNPAQQHNVNEFAKRINSNKTLALGSVNPDSDNKADAVREIAESGLHGVKLHPDYMNAFIDDERFDEIFEACAALSLPVVTHSGFDPLSPDVVHCTPDRLLKILRRHKDLKLVAAHLGAMSMADEVLEKLVGKPVWIDTSMMHLYDKEKVKRILLAHDPDRILFGSDTPWGDPGVQLKLLLSMNLPDSLVEKITHENAEALFVGVKNL